MKHKSIWLGGLIGGLYALLPLAIEFIFHPNESMQIVLLISFLLSAWTSVGIIWILSVFFSLLNIQLKGCELVLLNALNIILWIFIGVTIAWIVKKLKRGKA